MQGPAFLCFLIRKICVALSSGLTHTPTHTRKAVYEDDVPKRFKRSSYLREKGLKQLQTTVSRLRVRFVISRPRVRVTSLAPNHPVNRRLRGFFVSQCDRFRIQTHTLTHKRKVPETIKNPRRAGFVCSPGIFISSYRFV